jgi:hypothetical protein
MTDVAHFLRVWVRVWILGLSASLVLTGCAVFSTPDGGGGPSPAPVVEANLPEHPAVGLLQRIGSLPAGQPVTVADQVWVPGRLYSAASGRTCREVEVRTGDGGSKPRLACQSGADDGSDWIWYPVVAP